MSGNYQGILYFFAKLMFRIYYGQGSFFIFGTVTYLFQEVHISFKTVVEKLILNCRKNSVSSLHKLCIKLTWPKATWAYGMVRRVSVRACVRPSVRPSVRWHLFSTSPLKLLGRFQWNFTGCMSAAWQFKFVQIVDLAWKSRSLWPCELKTQKNLLLRNHRLEAKSDVIFGFRVPRNI